MVCIAINRFDSMVHYQRSHDGCPVVGDVYPVLYAIKPGGYSCTLIMEDDKMVSFDFHVKGCITCWLVNVCLYWCYLYAENETDFCICVQQQTNPNDCEFK